VIQVDDFKFVGVVFVPFGLAQVVLGFSGSGAIGGEGDLRPLVLMVSGVLTTTAGLVALRRRWWAKYLVGLAAFLLAPAFPFGTVLAAVAFLAIGRDWRRAQLPQAGSSDG